MAGASIPGPAALEAGDDVEARVAVAVAGAALAPLIGDLEAAGPQALANQLGAGHVGVARRVHGRDADELASERHEFVATVVQPAQHAVLHGPSLTRWRLEAGFARCQTQPQEGGRGHGTGQDRGGSRSGGR